MAKAEFQIGICGFQEVGVNLPPVFFSSDNKVIFTSFAVSDFGRSFEDFDGVIVPSGCFESIKWVSAGISGQVAKITYNRSALLERQRQLLNLHKSGGWICFLVDEIVDHISSARETQDVSAIDLVKCVLSRLHVFRELVGDRFIPLQPHANEFRKYVDAFGVAQTQFKIYQGDFKVLASFNGNTGNIAGLAIGIDNFFLPLHRAQKPMEQIQRAIEVATSSVLEYRAKNEIVIPDWVEAIEFEEEKVIATKMNGLADEYEKLQQTHEMIRLRKSILSTSGDILVEQVAQILGGFFGLKTERVENYVEDLKLLDDVGTVIGAIEIKGVTSGVKRDHVNQVDSHRERLELSESSPGVLIINDNSKVDGVTDRRQIEITSDQVTLAKKLNVTIVRTIDLLLWMVVIEKSPVATRSSAFVEMISRGGGWAKFDDETKAMVITQE